MFCLGSACTQHSSCSAAATPADTLRSYGDKLLALEDGSGRCSELYGATVDLVGTLAALVKTVSLLQLALF